MSNISQNQIRATTFNCHGYKTSYDYIRDSILDTSEIVMLQETWLLPHDIALPDNLSSNFNSFSISSVSVEEGLVRGRPYGGLTVM